MNTDHGPRSVRYVLYLQYWLLYLQRAVPQGLQKMRRLIPAANQLGVDNNLAVCVHVLVLLKVISQGLRYEFCYTIVSVRLVINSSRD